jgi:uncharacterized coiled-coil DUF342 family protein
MKTKGEREETSKKRQEVSRQLEKWEQNIVDLQAEIARDPATGQTHREQLVFCRQEHTKCKKELQSLNRGTYKQLCWASGKMPA